MIPVTDAQKQAYMTGGQKYLTLRFSDGTTLTGQGANSQINEGSMKLEQTLCDEEQLHFGRCNAASFSVQIIASSKRYKGLFVYPSITSNNVTFALGKYRVDNDELTDDRYYRTLTCYDQMTDLMTDDVSDWYAGINLPMTLKNFRDSLFTYFNNKYGVTQAPLRTQAGTLASLPNDNMIVQRTLDYGGDGDASDLTYTTNMNGQLMLEKICEINGCFGVINEDGKFEYRFLMYDERVYPADDLYPANNLYPVGGTDVIGGSDDDVEANFIQASLVWQEYEYQPITKVQIHQTENDIGAVVGTDGNDYEVFDNFLVYGMDSSPLQTVAQNLLNTIKQTISYNPAKVSVRGRPWIQTGDLLEVVCRGRTVSFPVLHRTMSGITALKDEYEAKGQEYFTFNVTGENHEFYGILQKVFEITKNVNGLRTYAKQVNTDLSTFESEITQTAEQIQTRVSNDEGLITTLTQRCDSIGLVANNTHSSIASIVAKINADSSSEVAINADKIKMTGTTTFLTANDVGSSGSTVIDGGRIQTGYISANRIQAGSIVANNDVTKLNLDSGDLYVGYGQQPRAHIRALNGAYILEYANGVETGSFYQDLQRGVSMLYCKEIYLDKSGGTGVTNIIETDTSDYKIRIHSNNGIKLEGYIYTNNQQGVQQTCWVLNSNGQAASLRFENGLLVETTGF